MIENWMIIKEEKPEDSYWGIVGHGVSRCNKGQAGNNHFQRVSYVFQDAGAGAVGGVIAEV